MSEVGEIEGVGGWEGVSGGGLHVAEDCKTFLVPLKMPAEEAGEDDDEEAVGEVGSAWITRLEAFFNFAGRRRV